MATKIVTGKARLSYIHAFTPRAQEEGKDPMYSVCILIPKTDKTTVARVQAAIKEAQELGKQMWGGKIPPGLKNPLRDGDAERDGDEYVGHWFINASSKQKPGVVDAGLNPIIDSGELYSGCYGRVSINFFPFAKAGNRGVGAGLNNIQKLEDGDPLGGARARPEDDFAAADDFLN